MVINQANAPSRGQRHLYGCTQNLCVFSACKCINQELFLRDSVCVSMGGSRGGGECSGRTQYPGSRIQCSVNALICSFGIGRNLKPGNKTIKTICNFDMFIRCSLSAFWGEKDEQDHSGQRANCS